MNDTQTRLCLEPGNSSQGVVSCIRAVGHPGYHQASLTGPDGQQWLARWFGVYVELLAIGRTQ